VALALVHEPDYFPTLVGPPQWTRSFPAIAMAGWCPAPGSRPGDPAAFGSNLPHRPLRTQGTLCLHRARPGHGGITVAV
jgi:hypothetical protein